MYLDVNELVNLVSIHANSIVKHHVVLSFQSSVLVWILRMFASNEKVFKLFSNCSFLIPKYKIRHMKTK